MISLSRNIVPEEIQEEGKEVKGFTAAVKDNSFEIQINVESLAPLLEDSCQMLAVELRSESR